MSCMPKKKSPTVARVLSLIMAYVTLCVAGGIAASVLLMPAVFAANKATQALVPSLQVEGIDFDVTSLPQKSIMYASDGTTKMGEFYEDNRIVVPIKNVSKYMRWAVVAREDKRFFEHAGVDVQGVLRAFVTNMTQGTGQGGSSLTQQYVKNVLITQAESDNDPIARYHAAEDTYARKIREMLIAVQMERKYSKLEILQGYLNIAQFGRDRLYGVETAARRYFNVSAKDLNIVQSATIAAITKNPEKYDPSVEANQAESQHQRNIVLQLMYEQGYITKAEYTEAKNTPLKDTLNLQAPTAGCQAAGDYAFFCAYVTQRILNSSEFGKTKEARLQLLKEGGLSIVTTLDVDANKLLMKAARDTIPPTDASGFEIMMASVKPGTGEVLGFGINRTYTGGDASDQTQTSMNYMVDAADGGGAGFPVGSTIKPFNMVAWMEAGRSINENLQTTTSYATSEFACENYNGKMQNYSGTTELWPVTNALTNGTVNPESPFLGLVRSHNTTQASMGAIIGLCRVADAYTEAGYHDASSLKTIDQVPATYNPAMMIGSVNVSPLTMANMYATLAADGVECTPIAMKKVTRMNGEEISVPKANCHQAIDKDIVQTVAYALNQGTIRSDGAGQYAKLDSGRKTFAKTGTNETMYMATGGFIPKQIATFVLVGDAQAPIQNPVANISINGTYRGYWDGGTIAAPAWKEFMDAYADKKGLGKDVGNDYGTPVSKYTTSSNSVTTIQGKTLGTYTNTNNSNNDTTNSNGTNGNNSSSNSTSGNSTSGNSTQSNQSGQSNQSQSNGQSSTQSNGGTSSQQGNTSQQSSNSQQSGTTSSGQ
ncbi:penicillin-binding protein [Bifidobacterium amazonense]|uniref:Penicillin-binding protein n=1 Tax=Bifidobacterium amazonense TaxID=2809027 RepID=A0ABS9VXT7_9BIFI|nr:transglycosylase domain-containing protein [Bifidobacterium amazonense]MCH9276925.1 penicillin-binding protein [Bifidobacterium amazonense]